MRRFRVHKLYGFWVIADNLHHKVYYFSCWCSAMRAIDDLLHPKMTVAFVAKYISRALNCPN